tara:strand:- start:125 stop:928 length:804 start_codon:yes stop_codon:yes gene_type:complete
MVDSVAQHYGNDGIVSRIISALKEAGFDINNLEPDVFAGADEFHIGGRKGSEFVAKALDLKSGQRLLDIGSGIGGPARFIANTLGVIVEGIDLTPEFVEAAVEITEMVGMGERVSFQVGSATSIPFDDDTFDASTMLHVGMNISDKELLFREIARVTKPNGSIVAYDVMRTGNDDLVFPLPWSSTSEYSFVDTVDAYVKAAENAGLELLTIDDHAEMALSFFSNPPSEPPPVNLGHLMGTGMPEMVANAGNAIKSGTISPVLLRFTN